MNLRVITLCAIPLLISLTAFSQERVRSLRPKYTSQMTVTGYTGQETLTNFPVAVRISPSNIEGFNYNQCKGQSDIVFSDANGMTLPHEIECWNTNGESVAWVSLPTMTTNSPTTFTMNWKLGAEPDSCSTSVWTNPKYLGVWHMNTPYDATLSANYQTNSVGTFHAKMIGASPSIVNTGKIGTELINKYAKTDFGDILSIPAPLTNGLNQTGFVISGWSYWQGYNRQNAAYIFSISTTSTGSYHWRIHVRYNKIAAKFGTDNHIYIGDNKINSGWLNWAVRVKNRTVYEYFVNGKLLLTVTEDAKHVSLSDGMVVQTGGTSGHSDELRIHNIAASDDWIKAEYDSVSNAKFITAAPAIRRPSPLQLIIR